MTLVILTEKEDAPKPLPHEGKRLDLSLGLSSFHDLRRAFRFL